MGSLVEMGLANALLAGILALVALIVGRYSRQSFLSSAFMTPPGRRERRRTGRARSP